MLLQPVKPESNLLQYITEYIKRSIDGKECNVCNKLKIYIEEQFIIENAIKLLDRQYHLLIKPDIVLVYQDKVEVIDIKSGSLHSDYLEQLVFYIYGLSKIFDARNYVCSIYSIKEDTLTHILHYNNTRDIEDDFNKLIDLLEKFLKEELKISTIRDLSNIETLNKIIDRGIHKYNKCFICNLKCICPHHGNRDKFELISNLMRMTTRDIIVVTSNETFVLSSTH